MSDSSVVTPPTLTSADPCPCCSGKTYAECCEPLLKGLRPAATAEEMMRSRYTAHVVHDFPYLHRTYAETAGTPYTEEEYGNHIKWTKLEVHSHEPDVRPGISHVDFSAHFEERGQTGVMHEKSEFKLTDGHWIFTRPLREGPAPVVNTQKVGRNDPCPCGSGKKYKKCCGK
ncbi:YchJ family protein [Actomonas aquatica]|uniref:YchJ family metal-binding protein n=1 Tax=Actomonas aquatica TaxID=2866162 RepID=A0ABZ1CA34_9BACT|nr:YchJ family metal-binding protein [Opitutus sp. WL0086]WRQ87180.1 YchJ family metal-binding protein [Opitutus sp. WL0086]